MNKRVREIKEEFWQRFSNEMKADMSGAQKRIWKLLRGMKKDTNETIQLKSITNEMRKNYFKNLYSEPENKEDHQEKTHKMMLKMNRQESRQNR